MHTLLVSVAWGGRVHCRSRNRRGCTILTKDFKSEADGLGKPELLIYFINFILFHSFAIPVCLSLNPSGDTGMVWERMPEKHPNAIPWRFCLSGFPFSSPPHPPNSLCLRPQSWCRNYQPTIHPHYTQLLHVHFPVSLVKCCS